MRVAWAGFVDGTRGEALPMKSLTDFGDLAWAR